MRKFPFPFRVLLVSSNFCRANEPRDAYGASCLANAFKLGFANDGAHLDVFTCDLNRFQDRTSGDYRIDWKLVADEIMANIRIGEYDVVAFSVFGWFEKAVIAAGKRIALLPRKPFIMLGGPAVFGEEDGLKKRYPFADMFAFGYGEKVFANLRRYIESGAASVFEQPDFKTLESPYLTGEIELGGSIDTVRAETRRGCPFRCTFCKHRDTYSGKVHSFSNYERHLEELKLFKRSGIKKLNVLDPFFDDMQGHGESYLKWIRKVGFEGKVSLQIRPETLTTSFTEEASMNPNIIFEIGVQSLDPNVLKAIRRGGARTKEQLRQKLALCKTLGVATEVTMIYGLPFQTYDSFARDIGIIRNYGVTKISAFPLQVYPGTELGDHVREYGLTLRENPFGIAEVAETPSRDFAKMQTLAQCV